MALESTFRTLSVQIRKLCDILNAVQLTLGDRPVRRGAALADELENVVLDLLGRLEEATAAARTAKAAVVTLDLERARRGLAKCQEIFHAVEQQFSNELVSFDRLSALAELGKERGGEWKAWANSMSDAVKEVGAPLAETSRVLAACWQELVEHGGRTSISIRTKNLGQKIVAKDSGEAVGGTPT